MIIRDATTFFAAALFAALVLASCSSANTTTDATAEPDSTDANEATEPDATTTAPTTSATESPSPAEGQSPDDFLVEGAVNNDLSIVEAALALGADANYDIGFPVVHLAADSASAEVVAALLDAGADPEIATSTGQTALTRAALAGNVETTAVLIEQGANIEHREGPPGRTILQLVIDQAPSIEVMNLLIAGGADLDALDDRGESALASAAFMGQLDATQLLIDSGASLDGVNNDGISPLEWAQRQGNDDIALALEAASAGQ